MGSYDDIESRNSTQLIPTQLTPCVPRPIPNGDSRQDVRFSLFAQVLHTGVHNNGPKTLLQETFVIVKLDLAAQGGRGSSQPAAALGKPGSLGRVPRQSAAIDIDIFSFASCPVHQLTETRLTVFNRIIRPSGTMDK